MTTEETIAYWQQNLDVDDRNDRESAVWELHVDCGLSFREIANLIPVSKSQAQRDWQREHIFHTVVELVCDEFGDICLDDVENITDELLRMRAENNRRVALAN